MYKVVVSKSPFRSEADEYGPYRFKWHAWFVAWYVVNVVNTSAEAYVLEE